MSETKQKNKKNIPTFLVLIISIITPILFLFIIYFKRGMVFEENDDLFISRILSGAITGFPYFHIFNVKFWVSAPISLLYHVTNRVPWWGLFLSGMFVLSNSLIIYYGIRKNRIRALFIPILDFAVCFSFMFVAVKMQYTSVAILMATTGYLCLISAKEQKSAKIWFVIMEFLAFNLRSEGMLLVQPFGMLILSGICFAEKEKYIKTFKVVLLALVSIAFLSILGTVISGEYRTEFRQFREFHKMRAEIYDYPGDLSYDDVKEILSKYDVNEEQWDAFLDYSLTDWSMDEGLSKELYEAAKKNHNNPGFVELMKGIYQNSALTPESKPVLVLLLTGILLALISRKPKYTLAQVGFVIAHLIVWSYIIFRGRILDRVSIPLYMTESLFLLFIISMLHENKFFPQKTFVKISVATVSILAFLICAFFTGRKEYRGLADEYRTQKILSESFKELEAYCDSHQDEKYIIDISSITSVHGEVLKGNMQQAHNYRFSGGWFAALPDCRKKDIEYLKGTERFYYVVADFDGLWDRIDCGTAKYYALKSGSKPIKADSLTVATGGTFNVYCYEGKLYE